MRVQDALLSLYCVKRTVHHVSLFESLPRLKHCTALAGMEASHALWNGRSDQQPATILDNHFCLL